MRIWIVLLMLCIIFQVVAAPVFAGEGLSFPPYSPWLWDQHKNDLLEVQFNRASVPGDNSPAYSLSLRKTGADKLRKALGLLEQNCFDESCRLLEELLQEKRGAKNDLYCAFLTERIAYCKIRDGKVADGEKWLQKSQSCNSQSFDVKQSKVQSDIYFLRSQMAFEKGKYAEATELMQHALAIEGKTAPHRSIRMSQILCALANCEFSVGDFSKAYSHAEIADSMLQNRNDLLAERLSCLYIAGKSLLHQGKTAQAKLFFEKGCNVALANPTANAVISRDSCLLLLGWGWSLLEDDPEMAKRLFERASKLTSMSSDEPNRILIESAMGSAFLRAGDYAHATEKLAGLLEVKESARRCEESVPQYFDFTEAGERETQPRSICGGSSVNPLRFSTEDLTEGYAELAFSLVDLAQCFQFDPTASNLALAQNVLEQARTTFVRLKITRPPVVSTALALQGCINCSCGNYTEAVTDLVAFLRTKHESSQTGIEAMSVAALLRAYLNTNQIARALELKSQLSSHAEYLQRAPLLFNYDYLLALLSFKKCDYSMALNYLDRVQIQSVPGTATESLSRASIVLAKAACVYKQRRFDEVKSILRTFMSDSEAGELSSAKLGDLSRSIMREAHTLYQLASHQVDEISQETKSKSTGDQHSTESFLRRRATTAHRGITVPAWSGKQVSARYWQRSSFPLRVYVDNDTGLQDNDKAIRAKIEAATRQWSTSSNGLVRFHFVDQPVSANLCIKITDAALATKSTGCTGYCTIERIKGTHKIIWSQIVIPGVKGPITKFDANKMRAFETTLLHELGHSLGMEHSANPRDLMYPYSVAGRALSQNDRIAILKLYSAKNSK